MPPQVPAQRAPAARRRSHFRFYPPHCEQLEERLALALFNVQTPALSFTGLNNNGCVAVADLNKDGLSDAVLTNYGTSTTTGDGTTITVLYRTAGGGFSRVAVLTGGTNVSFVSIADINGDTWPDVVACNANTQNTGSVAVFQNNGAGSLSLVGTPFSTSSFSPSWVGLSDLTGDGVLDVVVCSYGKDDGSGNVVGNNVTIFQGNVDAQGHGNFTFSLITTLNQGSQFTPAALAIADLDGDGVKDIAAAVPIPAPSFGDPQPNGKVYVFRGTGGGGFTAPNQYDSGGVQPVNIQAANLNGDSKLDLVVANAGDSNATPEFSGDAIGVLLSASTGPGNVTFGAPASLLDNTYGPFAVALGDFDRDGKTDIAAVNYGSVSNTSPNAFVSVYTGNGNGTFTIPSPATYDTQTGLPGGQSLAVGDFDGNFTPDLIVAHANNRVGLLLNTTIPPVFWDGGGDGTSWTDPLNWSTNLVPGAADDVVVSVVANPTVQIGSGTQSIKSLACTENLTINAGTLSVAAASQSSATLTLSGGTIGGAGDLTINGVLTWSGGTMSGSGKTIIAAGTLNVSAGSAKSLGRTIENQSGGQINWSAVVTLAAGSLVTGAGTVTFTNGPHNFPAGAFDPSGTINVNGGTASFANTLHLTTLNVANGARAVLATDGHRTLYANQLSLNASGALDLNDNDLVVNNGSFTQIRAWVIQGLGAGTTGIDSSTSTGATRLALFNNALLAAPLTNWNGGTISSTAIIGKYTYLGDVNLDGQVTGDDYTVVDSNLNTTPPAGLAWMRGDANTDGNVTGDDYTTIDSRLGSGVGNPLSPATLRLRDEDRAAALLR